MIGDIKKTWNRDLGGKLMVIGAGMILLGLLLLFFSAIFGAVWLSLKGYTVEGVLLATAVLIVYGVGIVIFGSDIS